MPAITDPPPAAVQAEIQRLRDAIEVAQVPKKQLDQNLIIATWNIREFGGLTEKWTSSGNDSPKRDLRSLLAIAEIISRFDVVAVQECTVNLKALRHLLKALGEHDWGFLLTDVTRGTEGNDERLGFIFDTRRVKLSGLAGEIVVPPEEQSGITLSRYRAQFARTPYAVAFKSRDRTFILLTLHVTWGDRSADRIPELQSIADWLAGMANDVASWGHNLIVLGDFNIDRRGDALYNAFTSTGLRTHPDFDAIPRTIFDSGVEHFYDQIAWFTEDGAIPKLSLRYVRGGYFDFVPVLKPAAMTKASFSFRMSDHYPMWAEFLL
ncbi:MAG: endonuclease/exonuclease/phosphatase family protein [Dehalococcoidia bacterium]